MTTSIRTQYLCAKIAFPHAILFFRLGDFYEMFDDDARIVARELSLALAERAFTSDVRAPMCGIPYNKAEQYVKQLVARGYTIAICEQIGDPRTAKGLVEREVVRIVAPASAVMSALLSAPDPSQRKSGSADAKVLPQSDGEVAQAATSSRSRTVRIPASGVQLVLFDLNKTQSTDGGGDIPDGW